MYSHYLDALAIRRELGNPQLFITFTCNANWPEIQRHMADFPQLNAADRADVICRVFEQKLKAFVKFLKKRKPFGNVTGGMYVLKLSKFKLLSQFLDSIPQLYNVYVQNFIPGFFTFTIICYAVLYTIEFQKRGLPHCHTLLWVSSSSRVQDAEDIDRYISAELPDPVNDPCTYKIVSDMMMHGPCGKANLNAPCMEGDVCKKNSRRNIIMTLSSTTKDVYIIDEGRQTFLQSKTT